MNEEYLIIAKNIKYLRKRRGMKSYLKILNVLDVKEDDYMQYTVEEIVPDAISKELTQCMELLSDCNKKELAFLVDLMRSAKKHLREYEKKTDSQEE